jgi:GDPmannose 4,6-dehydratase
MCGIVGYVGPREARPLLLAGLEQLEYRGYDSAGISVLKGDTIEAVRAVGNLSALRDWGHAKDYVEAMWRILQQDTPEDFVIATGITTAVREFVRMAFGELGIEVEFTGEGLQERGFVAACTNENFLVEVGKQVVAVDPNYFRPTEVELLIGDATKAKTKLAWEPKYDLPMLVKEMVESDVIAIEKAGKIQFEHLIS